MYQLYIVQEVTMIYVQNVPFIVSLSTAAVLGVPDNCQFAVLGKDRHCNIVTNVGQLV
jgi:hypothetical protein